MKIRPISSRELWSAQAALLAAILLQIVVWTIHPELTYGPHGLIIVTETILSVIIWFTSRQRHLHTKAVYRAFSIALLGLISVAIIKP